MSKNTITDFLTLRYKFAVNFLFDVLLDSRFQLYYNCTVLTTVLLFMMLYKPKNCSAKFFIVLKIKQMPSL